jgi:CRP-like cAMP-binding protein
MYKDVVQGVSLFSRVDDTFLSKVCMELQTRVFLPGDWIILKGDIGSELYIISRGVCQVFLRDPWEIVTQGDIESEKEILLSNGQFFGEISLLMEVRRTTSVQAKTICEVNVLVQEVFEEILRESPDFADEMKQLIVKRKIENFKKLHNTQASIEERELIEDAVNEAIESRQLMIGDYAERNGEDGEGGEEYDLPGAVPEASGSLPVRLAQAGRSPSGIALSNMGGTGFMKAHKTEIDAHAQDHLQPINESSSSLGSASSPVSPTSRLSKAMTASSTRTFESESSERPARDMSGMRQGTTRGFGGMVTDDMLNNDDVVSQQLGLLQERIDKIYAMLTTKLGRVR